MSSETDTPTNCNIIILDKEYSINCSEAEKDMLVKSSQFLAEKVQETRASGNVSGGERIMVMTALNIVYDLLQSQGKQTEQTDVDKRLHKMNNKVAKMLTVHKQIELTS